LARGGSSGIDGSGMPSSMEILARSIGMPFGVGIIAMSRR
jgi:hypothetical protein